jgi:hypothetical protein
MSGEVVRVRISYQPEGDSEDPNPKMVHMYTDMTYAELEKFVCYVDDWKED